MICGGSQSNQRHRLGIIIISLMYSWILCGIEWDRMVDPDPVLHLIFVGVTKL